MITLLLIISSTLLVLFGSTIVFTSLTKTEINPSNPNLATRNVVIGMSLVILGIVLYIIPILQFSSIQNNPNPSQTAMERTLTIQITPVTNHLTQTNTITPLNTPTINPQIPTVNPTTTVINNTPTPIASNEQGCPSLTPDQVAILKQVSSLPAAQVVAQALAGHPPHTYQAGSIVHSNWLISTTVTLEDINVYHLESIISLEENNSQERNGLFLTTQNFQPINEGQYWCIR